MSRLPTGVFPLVTQRRFVGVRVGDHRSPRRGAGDEVAGARPYRPGDRRTWIDWRASARLSAAHGADEFITREFFADTAPRVVVAIDSRPRMGLYDSSFPWLDKRAVVAETVRLVAGSTAAERGDLAVVAEQGGRPLWLSSRTPARALEQLGRSEALSRCEAGPGSLDGCLRLLVRHAPSLPAGTFVFVLSDFVDAVTPRTWQRLRALHWDVTPVVIQDPTWEQSFPDLRGVLVPVADVETGALRDVWVGRRSARERARENEARLDGLLAGFRRVGFDPVVLGSSEPDVIGAGFRRWADRRIQLRRRSA